MTNCIFCDYQGKSDGHNIASQLNWLQKDIWNIAENHGFHENRSRAKILALIHSEVSEALEADRDNLSKEQYAIELADIVIRVLDHAEIEDIELSRYILKKCEKNRTRKMKHGKKY